jgi:hypothetical protein
MASAAESLRRAELVAAWRRYLADTRALHGFEYEWVEPYAWAKLTEWLRQIAA